MYVCARACVIAGEKGDKQIERGYAEERKEDNLVLICSAVNFDHFVFIGRCVNSKEVSCSNTFILCQFC